MPTAIEPYIPYSIVVHLGLPGSSAENVRIPFTEYIKNVASSEIYPTWEESAIRANVHAQVSYALNRVYTEFYRSRGYDFDITNTTAYDQKFILNRNIFENIDRIVSEIFDVYISRIGNREPLAAKYCNGTTTTCNGLSQWGSQGLAEAGYEPFEILTTYYGNTIELIYDAPKRSVTESYPGYPLAVGSSGRDVATIQLILNRISQNYPLIPKISDVDGVFGEKTEASVKKFQQIFDLTPDGIVGKATWYKLIYLYVGIARLAELDSEGVQLFDIQLEYPDAVEFGDIGEKVTITQYFLSLAADFYPSVANTPITGVFGEETRQSVKSFQQTFGLPETGIVDGATWDLMAEVFQAVERNVFSNGLVFAVETLPYPGKPLKLGSEGSDVKALQGYLNAISLKAETIPPVAPTGVFGRQTEESVKQYQKFAGLPVTGVVGREDWSSIRSTYISVLSANTSRPAQNPGRTLVKGDRDRPVEPGDRR